MSLVVDEHREYLADARRVEAFRRAIAETVRPGAVVLDLGSGTGLFGLMACEAGARRVYAVEAEGIVELAREVAVANLCGDRITFVHALSSDVVLPERVDVIVSDSIGRFGFEAGLLDVVADARDRFLAPGGAIVPAAVELVVGAIESPESYARVDFWAGRPCGFDFAPARRWAANTGYPVTLERETLVGPPQPAIRLDSARATAGSFGFETRIAVSRRGTLHGIGGWFVAQLSTGAALTNSPLADDRINRRQVFFPIERPVPVEAGDTIHVDMRILPADAIVAWTVEVGRGGTARARFRHSTLGGMLVCADDLRRTHPRFVPALTSRGVARRSVLELCDGRRSLAEIERALLDRHGDLFRHPGEAGAFVAEVVTRYAR